MPTLKLIISESISLLFGGDGGKKSMSFAAGPCLEVLASSPNFLHTVKIMDLDPNQLAVKSEDLWLTRVGTGMELRRDKLNGKWVLKRDLSPPWRDNTRKLQKHTVLVQLFAKAKRFKTNMVLKHGSKAKTSIPPPDSHNILLTFCYHCRVFPASANSTEEMKTCVLQLVWKLNPWCSMWISYSQEKKVQTSQTSSWLLQCIELSSEKWKDF